MGHKRHSLSQSSISSARTIRDIGTSIPSAFAVVRLITKDPRAPQEILGLVIGRAKMNVFAARAAELALRCSKEQNALHTLIHQRHLTPSCGGHAPTAERTLNPARMFLESLTTGPELENS